MKENGNNSAITLCHRCKYGGEEVECCHCPELSPDPWRYFEPTDEHRAFYMAAQFMARQKMKLGNLPQDFSLMPYIAVASTVCNGTCRHYAQNCEK